MKEDTYCITIATERVFLIRQWDIRFILGRSVLALVLAFLIATPQAQAANDSWNVDASGNWITTTNWLSGTQVPGSTTTDNTNVATFSFTLTGGRTITVDSPRYIGGITFGNTSTFGYTLSGGAINLNSGGVIQTATADGAHTTTISTPITISGTSAATATITAGASSTTNHLIIGSVTGSATTGSTTTLTLNGANIGLGGSAASAGDNTVNGTISDGAGGGKLALTKAGASLWALSGTNTYTGITTISAGTLEFVKTASLYNGSTASWTAANLKVSSGATAAFNVGGTGEFAAGDVTTLLTNLTTGISNNGLQGGSAIGFNTALAATTFTVADNIANSTGTGSGTLGVTKLGLGSLTLSGTNTYTGITRVLQGTVTVAAGVDDSAANGGWNIGNSDNVSAQSVTFSAGSTIAVASGKTFQLGNTSASGTTAALTVAGTVSNAGTLNVQRAATLTVSSGGSWTQSAAMQISSPAGSGGGGAGLVTVASGGSFTYSNSTTSLIQINPAANGTGNGTLTISGTFTTNQGFTNTIATSTGAGVAAINLNGGTLKLSADVPVLTATAGTAFNFVLGTGGGTIDTQTFSTTMSRPISGTTGLTKAGTGTLALTAANTYAGNTTISAGALQVGVNSVGSTVSTSAVSVNGSTAVLAGTGTVNGAITVAQGFVRPGDTAGTSIGTLNTANVTVNGGTNAIVEMQLDAATPGTNDKIVSTGSLIFTAASHLTLATTATTTGTWDLLDWTTVLIFGNNVLSTTSTTGGSISTTDSSAFLDLPLLSGGLTYDLSNFISAGQIAVTLAPEPARVLLGLLGLMAIILHRRRIPA